MLSALFKLPLRLHHAYMRRLDLMILWPACKREAEERGRDLDTARAAFAMHAFRDPPWLALGHIEISRRIDRLS